MDATTLRQRFAKRRVKSIDVDGEQVFVRSLKRGEVVTASKDTTDNDLIAERLIVLSISDEQGNRLFQDGESLDLDVAIFVTLSKAIVEFNGLDGETTKKN